MIDSSAASSIWFDVVILSFAKDEALRQVTEHCLDSLVASEDPERIRLRIWVLESNARRRSISSLGL